MYTYPPLIINGQAFQVYKHVPVLNYIHSLGEQTHTVPVYRDTLAPW